MSKKIIIVGGGPVGLISAAFMGIKGFEVVLLESKPKNFNYQDSKALARSNSSAFIPNRLKVWNVLKKNLIDIHEIHVSQKKSLFARQNINRDRFGFFFRLKPS